jgi:hypothetical protein
MPVRMKPACPSPIHRSKHPSSNIPRRHSNTPELLQAISPLRPYRNPPQNRKLKLPTIPHLPNTVPPPSCNFLKKSTSIIPHPVLNLQTFQLFFGHGTDCLLWSAMPPVLVQIEVYGHGRVRHKPPPFKHLVGKFRLPPAFTRSASAERRSIGYLSA